MKHQITRPPHINIFAFLIYFLSGSALIAGGFRLGEQVRSFPIQQIDLIIARFFDTHRITSFIIISQFISSFEVVLLLMMIAFLCLFIKNKDKKAALMIVAGAIAWIIMRALKLYYNKACPEVYGITELYWFKFLSGGFLDNISYGIFGRLCYPSGHSANYLINLGILTYLIDKITSKVYLQRILTSLFMFLIVSVGMSRIVLGSHFVSDVIGGYLFGLGTLLIIFSIFQFK